MSNAAIVGYRVIVEPRRLGKLGFASIPDNFVSSDIIADYKARCEAIRKDIMRHVEYAGEVTVEPILEVEES